ncbi:hypothetical protein [Streptomyces sp. NPDC051219]|uniref:hypothetical protein n=1 Tax=Streptomyces sp. NPDC051219 TaxID=3155283 RepID=UPI00343C361A
MRKAMLGALMVLMVSGTGMAMPAPAGAQPARSPVLRAESEVTLAYDTPLLTAKDDRVTWHWVVTNTGDAPVFKVALTQFLQPSMRVTMVSDVCAVTAEQVIECKWDTLGPGEKAEGVVEADLPPGMSGAVRINGRIVWERSPSADSLAPATDGS